jgi:hypothetical protein
MSNFYQQKGAIQMKRAFLLLLFVASLVISATANASNYASTSKCVGGVNYTFAPSNEVYSTVSAWFYTQAAAHGGYNQQVPGDADDFGHTDPVWLWIFDNDDVSFSQSPNFGPGRGQHWKWTSVTNGACAGDSTVASSGGFLSYGTPDVIPYADQATGDAMVNSGGYTIPFCSMTDNPYNDDHYGKFHLWGVIPAGEHVTEWASEESGTGRLLASDPTTDRAGFCKITESNSIS